MICSQENRGEILPSGKHFQQPGKFQIHNSILSEYGILGFEYGYAMADPQTLTVWEAQFGDFANGAQIIIDQFISSAETKWLKMNGLVLLLPHGYEGQGPEHSSARIERFLQLCAEGNMVVANCSTPANFFHVLRKQVLSAFRKPLIVFTPKSLLRHPQCVSSLPEIAENTSFKNLIDDQFSQNKDLVKRLLFCSGKIYYDLANHQAENKRSDVAIIRLEQLYPLPLEEFGLLLESYPNAKEIRWVQEESKNQGPWNFVRMNLFSSLPDVVLCSRKVSSTTAVGFSKLHGIEQKKIINEAFAPSN